MFLLWLNNALTGSYYLYFVQCILRRFPCSLARMLVLNNAMPFAFVRRFTAAVSLARTVGLSVRLRSALVWGGPDRLCLCMQQSTATKTVKKEEARGKAEGAREGGETDASSRHRLKISFQFGPRRAACPLHLDNSNRGWVDEFQLIHK